MNELEELKMELAEIKGMLKKMQEEPMFLSVDAAAKKMGICRQKLDSLIKNYTDFPANKSDSRWKVRLGDLNEWLRKHKKF